MKRCQYCKQSYEDSFVFCPNCGNPLVTTQSSPKLVIPVLISIIIIFILSALIIHEHQIFAAQQVAIEAYQAQKYLDELRNTPKTTDLTIDSGWSQKVNGNYIYIDGFVTNDSAKYINYYEIGADFLDASGNIIDTDWTNGTDIAAHSSQEFSFMHKRNSKYSQIHLYIKAVN